MRIALTVLVMLTVGVTTAVAEGPSVFPVQSHIAVIPAPADDADAPFRRARGDMPPGLLMREEKDFRELQSGCDRAASTVCYDMGERRIVYRKGRKYMPEIDGLRAESISLRRDRIIFKYSFR